MYLLKKETAMKLSTILASSYYKEWVEYMEKVQRASRNKKYRSDRKRLLAIQLKLARNETLFWKMLREGRSKVKKLEQKGKLTPKEQKDLEGAKDHIFIHEQLIRIARTICDGIAWRNLGYNRTFLHSAARGLGAGAVDAESKEFQSEFMWAYKISEALGSIVIMNDLTRFLRVGDLTEISKGIPFIHEIKRYGKAVKNMFTLRNLKGKAKISGQGKRLLELQRIAFSKKVQIGSVTARTNTFNTELKTNFPKLKKLLRESEEKLVVTSQFEPCLIVEVTNFGAIQAQKKNVDIEKLKAQSRLARPKGLSIIHSNWDTFYTDELGNFLRSTPPYSIFPLSEKDCTRLMSGDYLVLCMLDVDKLKEILKSRGWEIEDIKEEELDTSIAEFEKAKGHMYSVKESLYKFAPDEPGIFRIKRGPFNLTLSASIYVRLTMEFMSLDTFLAVLEEMYDSASRRKESDAYFASFKNESEVWN